MKTISLGMAAAAGFFCPALVLSTVAGPLIPPTIEQMLYVGRGGPSRSANTRYVLKAGDYVYCSGERGLQTVDVSNPAAMIEMADWEGSQCSAMQNGLAIKDGILFVANWSPGVGLLLFNLANPAQPHHLKTVTTIAHTWAVEFFGNLMYVSIAGNPEGQPDVIITRVNTYDVTDVTNPVLLNSLVVNDRMITNVARYGNTIYFGHERYLEVYDVSDPANPSHRRTIDFNTLLVKLIVRDNYLYVLGRDDPGRLDDGGIWRRSLSDPTNPTPLAHWDSYEPRDMCFVGSLCIVPASGGGVFTLDASQVTTIPQLAHWGVSWPNNGHGGYPVCVTGSGNHVYIGTANNGNNPAEYQGARLYSVRVAMDPPVIAPVTPNPDIAKVGLAYSRQLSLLQGDPAPTWSKLEGPAGLQVSSSGLVSGWQPAPAELGSTRTISVRASNQAGNQAGSDTETWQVQVKSRADFDDDQDVDQSDFGLFQVCFSGAGQNYPAGCQNRDFDGDGAVDTTDFGSFQSCMRGAGQSPGC